MVCRWTRPACVYGSRAARKVSGADDMMTKATWDRYMQAMEWKSTVKNGPTLDEAVAQYYRWSRAEFIKKALGCYEWLIKNHPDELDKLFPKKR